MLVHGAAGGVGTAALQVAKGLGASTIAVVSSDDKERVARDAGADDVVRSDGPWKDEAKELSGGGVDVVLDPVGGDRFTDSLRSLREGGRVVVVGFTGGSIPEVRVNRLLLANTEVVGAGWGAYVMAKPEPEPRDRRRDRAADRRRASCAPLVGARFPLERAADALDLIDSRGGDRQGRPRRSTSTRPRPRPRPGGLASLQLDCARTLANCSPLTLAPALPCCGADVRTDRALPRPPPVRGR